MEFSNLDHHPLADVGPVVVDLSFVESATPSDTADAGYENLKTAFLQHGEPAYWDAVHARVFMTDQRIDNSELHAALELLHVPAKGNPVAQERIDRAWRILRFASTVTRSCIERCMAQSNVRGGLTLRLFPDDVATEYTARTRALLLQTLRRSPHDHILPAHESDRIAQQSFNRRIDVTLTPETDGIVLSSEESRYGVLHPLQWHTAPQLLASVQAELDDDRLIRSEQGWAMAKTIGTTQRLLQNLQEEWRRGAPKGVTAWIQRQLRRVSGTAQPNILERANATLRDGARDWVAALHEGLDRRQLKNMLS